MSTTVSISYTNHRGETRLREIEGPMHLNFGTTLWHPITQWLLTAWDTEKQADRTFAMKDIRSWSPK